MVAFAADLGYDEYVGGLYKEMNGSFFRVSTARRSDDFF
jgi:hypothetical protein